MRYRILLQQERIFVRLNWTYLLMIGSTGFFLEKAMLKLGFNATWVRWIKTCVSSVRYSVRFNGVLSEPFQPTRGLRQGDPLSPYLFLFVADALSIILQKEAELGRVEELRISRNAPGISHLLFADGALLFFRALPEQGNISGTRCSGFRRVQGSY